MAFDLDDDDRVFDATMAFVDEFPFDDAMDGSLRTPQTTTTKSHRLLTRGNMLHRGSIFSANTTGAIMSLSDKSRHVPKSMPQTERFNAPRTLVSIKDKRNQRDEVNAKKKLLRKAGIYGDSNRVRNERKLEIAYLRERIEKLQIDLKTLQTQKISNGATSPGKQQVTAKQPATNSLVLTNVTSGVWLEIADRQQRRRKEAERENIRLKLVVERQRKVANTMSSLLQKRANQMGNECSCFTSLGCRKHHVVHVLDVRWEACAFRNLFRHLDTAYRDIDAVFTANGLSGMLVTPSDVHIRKNVGGKYLEVFSNKVVPFPLCTTAEAVWGHFKGTDKHMGNGSLYEKTAKDLDEPYTIIENFTKEVFSNNARADVKMKQVVRRFVEKDRDIVIWVASVAPIEIKHKMLRGLTYHLRGYALTKRSTVSIPGCELSQLQFCTLIIFDQEAVTSYDPVNLQALTNFLLVNTTQNMRVHQNGIENTLIDQALRQNQALSSYNTHI